MSITTGEIDAELRDVIARIEEAKSAGKKDVVEALDERKRQLFNLRDSVVMAANRKAAGELAEAAAKLAEIVRDLEDPLLLLKPTGEGEKNAGDGGPAVEDSQLGELESEPPVAIMDTPKAPPAGGPSRYIRGRRSGPKVIAYTDDQGRGFLRTGGTRAWRNNNPGNIRKGSFADACGAIGDDGGFAIFPDRKTGLDAVETLLRGKKYIVLTLEAAMNRYAPKSENDTEAYISFIEDQTGLKRDVKLEDLPVASLRKIVQAIVKMEGWEEGHEAPDQPASAKLAKKAGAGGVSSAVGAAHEWMSVARAEMALAPRETAGPKAHPRILEYHKASADWVDQSDEVSWCAGFVNFCLQQAGFTGTGHPGARSFVWNEGSRFVVLEKPRNGCIGVMRRKPFSKTRFHDDKWKTGEGHVGFVVAHDASSVTLLGGNQSNTVNETRYPLEVEHNGKMVSQFVAFLMPAMN